MRALSQPSLFINPLPPTTSIPQNFSFSLSNHQSQSRIFRKPTKPNKARSIFSHFLFRENVGWIRKMQQNPPHCEAKANAKKMAQQGPHVRSSHTVGCPSRIRGGLCRHQLQEICSARDVPEPSRFQETSRSS